MGDKRRPPDDPVATLPRGDARRGELPPQAVLTLDEDMAVVGETASTIDPRVPEQPHAWP